MGAAAESSAPYYRCQCLELGDAPVVGFCTEVVAGGSQKVFKLERAFSDLQWLFFLFCKPTTRSACADSGRQCIGSRIYNKQARGHHIPRASESSRLHFLLGRTQCLQFVSYSSEGNSKCGSGLFEQTPSLPGRVGLHQKVFKELGARWGSPEFDLFATRSNVKVTMFCSLVREDWPWALDAFTTLWAFPLGVPFCHYVSF